MIKNIIKKKINHIIKDISNLNIKIIIFTQKYCKFVT